MADQPYASRLPRPSRLPIPKGARPSPSRDNLRASTTISVARARPSPSRNASSQAFSPTATADLSSNIDIPTAPVEDDVFKKPTSRPSSSHHQQQTQNILSQTSGNSFADCFTLPDDAQKHENNGTRKPRLSLSERTMETLAQLPPSPAVRRTSTFRNEDSPIRNPSYTFGSRPNSSHLADSIKLISVSTLPGSRAESGGDSRTTSDTFLHSGELTPQRISASKTLKTPLRAKSNLNLRTSASASKLTPPVSQSPAPNRPSSPVRGTPTAKPIAKTIGARPPKIRPTVKPLVRKPSLPAFDTSMPASVASESKMISPTFSHTSSEEGTTMSRASKESSTTIESIDSQITPNKSSNALRDQIAKARAAKKAQATAQKSSDNTNVPRNGGSLIPNDNAFDFGLVQDPFNQNSGEVGKGVLRKRIDAARTDGRLNIAAMGLKQIPDEVMEMYNFETINGSWAESVDLTRLVAADNELEELGEDIFPDVDARDFQDDVDAKGNQFGGLETLDLHGNLLKTVPPGLRRLEMLTTLNLSNNKLENDCFNVISQVSSLRELKLARNKLSGELSPTISKLQNLEILDVQDNKFSSLPDGLVDLVRLRVLTLSGNVLTTLPFDKLRILPLIELSAARNKLDGILVRLDDVEFPNLQTLDVTSNALLGLSSGRLELPALHQLNCSVNRLTTLPDMTSWKSLLTLSAEDNNISEIPEGFTALPKLKTAVLSGNNLRLLDDQIGNMTALDIFRVSGNPLREKKFAGMTTDDLKKALKGRLAPIDTGATLDIHSGDDTIRATSPGRAAFEWPIKPGGVLDRSHTQLSALNPVTVAQIASSNAIRELLLHHNAFKEIPTSIGLFSATLTSLSLSHNELNADTFLGDELELPFLKSLNLSSNTFTTVAPLLARLHAPALMDLDISFNRLTTLPLLRPHFPSLRHLLASNNAIRELSPDAVKGLRVLDCSSNDLSKLDPKIGLLGGEDGLRSLEVKGNRFRVPRFDVLDKGTEATLAWLRDRIPAGEGE